MRAIVFLCALFVTYKHEAMNICNSQQSVAPLVLQKAEEIYYQNLQLLFPPLYSFQVPSYQHIAPAQFVRTQIKSQCKSEHADDYQNSQNMFSEEIELERLKRIVAEGGNLDVRDKQGNTPLMRAAINFWIPVVKFLLEHNADISCKNHANYSFEKLLEEPSEPNELFAKRCTYQLLYQNVLEKKKKKSTSKKVSFQQSEQEHAR